MGTSTAGSTSDEKLLLHGHLLVDRARRCRSATGRRGPAPRRSRPPRASRVPGSTTWCGWNYERAMRDSLRSRPEGQLSCANTVSLTARSESAQCSPPSSPNPHGQSSAATRPPVRPGTTAQNRTSTIEKSSPSTSTFDISRQNSRCRSMRSPSPAEFGRDLLDEIGVLPHLAVGLLDLEHAVAVDEEPRAFADRRSCGCRRATPAPCRPRGRRLPVAGPRRRSGAAPAGGRRCSTRAAAPPGGRRRTRW